VKKKLIGNPIYHNDKTAPRMRKGQFSKQIVNKQLWWRFIEDNEKYEKVTWDEFRKLWDDIAYTIREEAVENPLGVKLPKFIGELKVQYLPYLNHGHIDHIKSNELGIKVKNLGIVDKGKRGTLKWERRWAVKFNRMLQFFAFQPGRTLKLMTVKKFNKHPEKIRMSGNTLRGHNIWTIYRNKRKE